MINSAHLHLILNHFPVIGTIVIILIVLYGILRKNKEVIRAGLIVTVIIALITIFTYTTGEGAEDIVEGMDGVMEEHIEDHEDFALNAFIGMEILGAVSLIGLFLFNRTEKYPGWYVILYLFLLLTIAGMMSWTAHLGGQIHHPEIIQNSTQQSESHENGDHDDD